MQRWANFIAKHPNAHVLVGRTRNVTQWRSNAVRQLINAQRPSGEFSLSRDLDDEQGYLLIRIGFEKESDAEKLALPLGAKRVDTYDGYRSAYEFDPTLLAPARRRRAAGLIGAAGQTNASSRDEQT